ncbi:MAG TPA: DUF5808 domain-containing protein [Ktedonobacterales bacterium]|nr:DUF5808 domain-containing protein [Ktedonobacterales bacterium]
MNVSEVVVLLLCAVLILGLLVLFLPTHLFRARNGSPAERRRGGPVYRDDERYWMGGFLYNNPDDPDLLVPKRYGLGWTFNFGHPAGKWVAIAMIALPLLLALLGIFAPGFGAGGCHTLGCHLP